MLRGWLWSLVAVILLLMAVVWPGGALADPPACPAGGLDPSGLSQPEREVRELRNDLASVCAVVHDDLGALDARFGHQADQLDGVESGLSTLHGDVVDVGAAVGQVHDDLAPPVAVAVDGNGPTEPVFVADPASTQTAADAYTGIRAALWFGIGLLAVLVPAYGIYRVVMPRA